jgi:signal transduction histidine kinase
VLNIAVGIAQLALGTLLLRSVLRPASRFPWLVALAAFFLVRGAEYILQELHAPPPYVGQLADLLVIAALVLLFLGLGRTIAGLEAAYDGAELQRREYARALHDYRQLARHRIANPLAAIRGGVATLRDIDDLDVVTRRRLLEMLDEQAARLQEISLGPGRGGPEERSFDALPEVPDEKARAEAS